MVKPLTLWTCSPNKTALSPPMSEQDSWLHQSIFSVQTTVVNINEHTGPSTNTNKLTRVPDTTNIFREKLNILIIKLSKGRHISATKT